MRYGGLIVLLAAAACGGDGQPNEPPANGTLKIITTTTGSEIDPNGYTVQIDGGASQAVGTGATLESTQAPGTHTVQLAGLAPNCTLQGDNLRAVTVTGDNTASITFAITCAPTVGALTISIQTTGDTPDPDGYRLAVDGKEVGSLDANGSITLEDVKAGTHSVGISGVAANCELQGDNVRATPVAPGNTATQAFTVTCAAPPPEVGTLVVTTVTNGAEPDPDGYTFALDQSAPQPIGVATSVTLANTPAGPHTVQLSGVAASCAADANPLTVSVPSGGTVEAKFTLECTAAGSWATIPSNTSFQLNGVWGSSSTDLFAVGEPGGAFSGAIFHSDGSSWSQQFPTPELVMQGVWGTGPTDVFAVGSGFFSEGGALLHYDGSAWTAMTPPAQPDAGYSAVWGSSPSDVFAVGSYFDDFDKLLIAHFDGSGWTEMSLSGESGLLATDVHGTSGTDVFVAGYRFPGDGYFISHYDGSSWTSFSSEDPGILSGVWANAPNDVFAVGNVSGNALVLHYDGSTWNAMPTPPAGRLSAVWGASPTDVYAVGPDVILHYDGVQWASVSNRGGNNIWGISPAEIYVVGANGSILKGPPQSSR